MRRRLGNIFGALRDIVPPPRPVFKRTPDHSGAEIERTGRALTQIVSGRQALQNAKRNDFKNWNRSTSSGEVSEFASDASRRIFDDFAALVPTYTGPRLRRDSKVFAMGSCFAREIERALVTSGANVVSVDSSINRDEFRDPTGKVRDTFFHRFTPRSISQEFMACLGDLPGWSPHALIFPQGDDRFLDLNYWQVEGADESGRATDVRREVARALVCRAAEADVIILTLGLTEAWLHKPTGLFANFTTPQFLARHRDDFELHLIGVEETIECLGIVDNLLRARHPTGNYQIVLTVSPAPLSATFTEKDVVVANMESKAILRAAAAAFVAQHNHAHYFPSFEMVNYSERERTWRPDRIHVRYAMVSHILSTFLSAYFEEGAFNDRPFMCDSSFPDALR